MNICMSRVFLFLIRNIFESIVIDCKVKHTQSFLKTGCALSVCNLECILGSKTFSCGRQLHRYYSWFRTVVNFSHFLLTIFHPCIFFMFLLPYFFYFVFFLLCFLFCIIFFYSFIYFSLFFFTFWIIGLYDSFFN